MHNQPFNEPSTCEAPPLDASAHNGTHGQDDRREILPAWVQRCSDLAINWKKALSVHSVTHLLRYGDAIQMGSGTTFSRLMDEIIDLQKRKREPLDLVILTTNLQVLEQGRDARQADPEIFHDMQIILTGGSLQLSLHSLAGEFAAAGIRTEVIFPRIVFLGAAGLAFDGGEVTMTYQFQEELATQVSYATRPTVQRVILCDHTKLGTRSAWKAEITARRMLAEAQECLIISTFPENPSAADNSRIKQQIQCFDQMLDQLAKDRSLDNKDLALRFVNRQGEVHQEFSLSSKRAEAAPTPRAPAPRRSSF
jgi:DeoR/GlpR family transcriptional regulator of sugar metabolism